MTPQIRRHTSAVGEPAAAWRLGLASAALFFAAVNGSWALTRPDQYAEYFGAPASAAGDAVWIRLFGTRMLTLAAAGIAPLRRRDRRALSELILAATVMPVADTIATRSANANTRATRLHAIGAAVIPTLALALLRPGRSQAQPSHVADAPPSAGPNAMRSAH